LSDLIAGGSGGYGARVLVSSVCGGVFFEQPDATLESPHTTETNITTLRTMRPPV
jgi:hypothetical protein